MTQNHVDRDLARAILVDMFPDLPPDIVLARFDTYPEPGAFNDMIDDLMAYSIDCEAPASRDVVIQSSDNEDVDDDANDEDSGEDGMRHQLALIEMFPDFDLERLNRICQMLDGNFDEAVAVIMELANDDISKYPEEVKILSDLCPMIPVSVLHGALVERNFLLDDVIRSIFPDAESNEAVQYNFQTKLNMADHIKFTSFKRMFPNSTEEVILEVMKSENNLYVQSLEALQAIFGPPAVKSDAIVHIAHTQSNASQLPPQPADEEVDLPQLAVDRLDRLYSGRNELVSDKMIKLAEAEICEFSEQRAELRRRAQNAISDRQMFHSQMLYEKIRNLDDRINAAREQLMVSIFIRNNPRACQLKSIDLHGIYVREARRLVSDFISRVRLAFGGNVRQVSIIVGIGRHSTTSFYPKLRPAIIRLLRYLKLKFEIRSGEIIVLIA